MEGARFRLGRRDLVDEFGAAQDEIENSVVDRVDLPAQAGEGVFGRCQREAPDDVLGQGCCLGDIGTKGKTGWNKKGLPRPVPATASRGRRSKA